MHSGLKRVLIVDDSSILRQRLERLLNAVAGITIAGQAEDADAAVALIGETSPDAVILDLALRSGSGLDVLERLQGVQPRPAMIVLTNYPHDEYRRRCFELGADAFLDKAAEFEQVLAVLLAPPAAREVRMRPDNTGLSGVNLDRMLGIGPAALFVLRVEGDVLRPIWTSDNVEGITGYAARDTLSPTWHHDHVHPDDLSGVTHGLEQLFASDRTELQYRFRHRDGEWIWLQDNLSLVRDDRGNPVEVFGAMLNVTERMRVKTALADREQRYRILAEATSDGIAILEDGVVHEVNLPLIDLLGYTEAEALGRPVLDFVAPSSRALAVERLASAEPGTTELRLLARDGCERIVSATSRLHRTDDRELRLVAVHDLTVRRQLEEQFHQAQKMEAVGRLAGAVAHDFNNALAVVLGGIELAADLLEPEHPAREDLQDARTGVHRGIELAKQLLGFSRPQPAGMAACDVNAVLAQDEHLLRRLVGSSITYTTMLPQTLQPAAITDGQLRQVVMNLVINARDAMPSGGSLTIETSMTRIDGCIPTPLRPGPYVRLAVRDTGIGMDANVQSHIFEPFFTTKEHKGTGLGLASVYGIVTHAGGSVAVNSSPGNGAEFELLLPVAMDLQ